MALDQPPAVKKFEELFEFTIFVDYPRQYSIMVGCNGYIDWGDGHTTEYREDNYQIWRARHQYNSSGYYKIIIKGLFFIDFYNDTDQDSFLYEVHTKLPKKCDEYMISGQHIFRDCLRLEKIPSTLFYNLKSRTNFNNCFRNAIFINIPSKLFDSNINALSFDYCFFNDEFTTFVPQDLFIKNINANSFKYCFFGCRSIVSPVPELWITHPNANGQGCYYGCINAANYSSIPSSWR